MKRIITTVMMIFSCVVMGFSQSPNAINYQAVARDGAGALLTNQNMDVRIGIFEGPGGAVKIYEETQSTMTNQYGQFSLRIGNGTATLGDFSLINWGSDEHHMKVEVNDGSEFVDFGMSQLVAVPYAYHSRMAEKASDMGLSELNNVSSAVPAVGNVLGWNGSEWAATPDNAGQWASNGNDISFSNGSVGIGTTTPDHVLTVFSPSGTSYIRVADNTSGTSSGLRMGMSGSGNAYIINDEANKSLSLGTNGTTQMRIMDNGRVGINELTPDQMLHIKQNVSNKGLRIEHQSTADYWENGIGTTTKNYKFYFNNLFRADISSTDGSYTQSSDRRLKRDIAAMEPVLAKVNQLAPSNYHYIDNADEGPRSIGFIAQDVEKLFPELVRDLDDGYKGIVYDGFAVISIKAIQELNEKVAKLEKEIEELTNTLSK